MPLASLLEQFRQGGAHFVLVEEGDHKVIGFLTMEDVLEVLVGDIQDEHRKTERGARLPARQTAGTWRHPLFKLERLLTSTSTTSRPKPCRVGLRNAQASPMKTKCSRSMARRS